MVGMILGPDGIIVIVAVAAVLIFGGSRIPKLARGIGSASREFKLGSHSEDVEARAPAPVPSPTVEPLPGAIHHPLHQDVRPN